MSRRPTETGGEIGSWAGSCFLAASARFPVRLTAVVTGLLIVLLTLYVISRPFRHFCNALVEMVDRFLSASLFRPHARRKPVPQDISKLKQLLLDAVAEVFPTGETSKKTTDALRKSIDRFLRDQNHTEHWVFISILVLCVALWLALIFFVTGHLDVFTPLTFQNSPEAGAGQLAMLGAGLAYIIWAYLCAWTRCLGIHFRTRTLLTFLPIPSALIVESIVAPSVVTSIKRTWPSGYLEGTYLAGIVIFFFWCFPMITTLVDVLRWRTRCWRDPKSYFLFSVFQVLHQVKYKLSDDISWDEPENRSPLLSSLEEAAQCLEILCLKMPARDSWIESRFRQALADRSAGIRELKLWILIPRKETRFDLEQRLRKILDLAAAGDWDGLPLPQTESRPKDKATWGQVILRGARSLTIAVVPLLGLIVANTAGVLKFGDATAYLFIMASVWAAVNMLAVIDPKIGDRFSLFKEAAGIFTGKKEK